MNKNKKGKVSESRQVVSKLKRLFKAMREDQPQFLRISAEIPGFSDMGESSACLK